LNTGNVGEVREVRGREPRRRTVWGETVRGGDLVAHRADRAGQTPYAKVEGAFLEAPTMAQKTGGSKVLAGEGRRGGAGPSGLKYGCMEIND